MDASKHFFAVKIQNLYQGNYQYVVNIYVPNNKNARKKYWDSLSKLESLDYNFKQLMLGDCNVPLYEHEKKGGNTNQLEDRLDLMDFINKEGLMDMEL